MKKYEKLTKKKNNNLIRHIKKQFHINDEKNINPVFKHDSSATRIIIVNDGINRTITLRKFVIKHITIENLLKEGNDVNYGR